MEALRYLSSNGPPMKDQKGVGIEAPSTSESLGATQARFRGSTYTKSSRSFIFRPSGSHSVLGALGKVPQLLVTDGGSGGLKNQMAVMATTAPAMKENREIRNVFIPAPREKPLRDSPFS